LLIVIIALVWVYVIRLKRKKLNTEISHEPLATPQPLYSGGLLELLAIEQPVEMASQHRADFWPGGNYSLYQSPAELENNSSRI